MQTVRKESEPAPEKKGVDGPTSGDGPFNLDPKPKSKSKPGSKKRGRPKGSKNARKLRKPKPKNAKPLDAKAIEEPKPKRRRKSRKTRTTENAVVKGTFLGINDGCLTFFVDLGYAGGRVQKLGNILFTNEKGNDTGCSAMFLHRICSVFNVKSWEELTGKLCRVEHDDHRVFSVCHIIDASNMLYVDDLLVSTGNANQIERLDKA